MKSVLMICNNGDSDANVRELYYEGYYTMLVNYKDSIALAAASSFDLIVINLDDHEQPKDLCALLVETSPQSKFIATTKKDSSNLCNHLIDDGMIYILQKNEFDNRFMTYVTAMIGKVKYRRRSLLAFSNEKRSEQLIGA
ncbi:MAG: hypothetical protein CMP10_18695 [Zetaproteobacteria bacterium]|nr:hypothetical protein [Pseudobdellovibrionaceae bacterium]|tara:strand:- start:309 stop:728 length:420 start_codon:yes stop_codon:yes gene_type:complete